MQMVRRQEKRLTHSEAVCSCRVEQLQQYEGAVAEQAEESHQMLYNVDAQEWMEEA